MIGKSSKQKTTNEPSAYAKSYITPAANALASGYAQSQPGVQAAADAINAGLPGIAARAFGTSPLLGAAQGYATDVLSGKYLGQGNPWLQSMIDQTGASTADRVNATFGAAGRTGSGRHVHDLIRALADSENGLRYGDYGAERAAMANAASQAAGLDAAHYAGIAPLLGMAHASLLPQQAAQGYAGGIGGLLGPYNNNTQTSTPSAASSIAQGIGTALNLASIFSDRRLKTDIRKLGEEPDGLGHYAWRYVWGGP